MPKKTDNLDELLTRGVDTIYPSKGALSKRLADGKPLSLYLGIDPSGADLHIGHTVALQKLRQFQKAGHKVILLIGNFTGQTGDPTDKRAARKPLTKAQVMANAKHYQKQAARVLDFKGKNPVELRFNADWLGNLKFSEVAELAGHFTVQQMLERDMFADRLKGGKPISLREFLYPLMQGYDSVAMQVDLEIGGTDQTFNMLAGRKLAKEYLGKEKFVLTVPILADSSGAKIGKTEGNAIEILGKPEELYGQLMGLPDEVIGDALEWTTSVPLAEVGEVRKLAKQNPRDAKMRLAKAVVAEYQGDAAAKKAEQHFVTVFQKHELPDKVPEKKLPTLKPRNVRNLLVDLDLAASTSEARRLIEQGAVRRNEEIHAGATEVVPVPGDTWRVGKKKIIRIAD